MKQISRRRVLQSTALFAGMAGAQADVPYVEITAHPFDLREIKILDRFVQQKQDLNIQYLLELDADRLLHNFRVNAGLPSAAKPLGGWEAPNIGLRGHFTGHYLTATAYAFRATGNLSIKSKAAYIVSELRKCQNTLGNGYLSAFPAANFDTLETKFGGAWAPYYTIHKIMAGLFDQYKYCGDATGLEICKDMAAYFTRRLDRLSPEVIEKLFRTTAPNPQNEFGGMSEVLHNLYGETADPTHLRIANLFDREWFIGPLSEGSDNLTNLHANTHIPQILGAARRYELTGEKRYRLAVAFFWKQVALKRSFATGGSSGPTANGSEKSVGGEHWGEPGQLASSLTPAICESCVTHNLLRVTDYLFRWSGDPIYAEFYERAWLNSVLTMQHPHRVGEYIYEHALAGESRKFFGDFDNTFWCCYGTSVDAFSRLGGNIYYHNDDKLWVNFYVSSELNWKSKGVRLTQTTANLGDSTVRFDVKTSAPAKFTVNFRAPSWAAGATRVALNDTPLQIGGDNGFISVTREWQDGDRVELFTRIAPHLDPLPGDKSVVAISCGPLVLAAASRQRLIFAGEPDGLLSSMRVDSHGKGSFRLALLDGDVTLQPLNEMVDQYYGVYVKCYATKSVELENAVKESHTTIDRVLVNDATSEGNHQLRGDKMEGRSLRFGRESRRATGEGWFSYELTKPRGATSKVQCAFENFDKEPCEFEIYLSGVKISQPVVRSSGLYQTPVLLEFPIPAQLVQGDRVTVNFRALGKPTALLTDLRLLVDRPPIKNSVL